MELYCGIAGYTIIIIDPQYIRDPEMGEPPHHLGCRLVSCSAEDANHAALECVLNATRFMKATVIFQLIPFGSDLR